MLRLVSRDGEKFPLDRQHAASLMSSGGLLREMLEIAQKSSSANDQEEAEKKIMLEGLSSATLKGVVAYIMEEQATTRAC